MILVVALALFGLPIVYGQCPAFVCPNGYYYDGSQCLSCNKNDPYTDNPYNSSYTGQSPVNYYSMCPWSCNSGYYRNMSNCYPDSTCFSTQTTVRSCVKGTFTCPAGQYHAALTGKLLGSQGSSSNDLFLNIYDLTTALIVEAVGTQCSYVTYQYVQSFPGPYNNSLFCAIYVGRQSGSSDISVIMDLCQCAFYLVNRTSKVVSLLAGGTPAILLAPSYADGIGSDATFFLSSDIPPALSHDGNIALVFDSGLIRMINVTTGQVTTLTGQFQTIGYAEGTGTNVLYSIQCNTALSPDGSFALVTDTSSIVRYLNISTRTSSLLVGQPSSYGNSDGVGTNARLFDPRAMAISNSGKFALVANCPNPDWYGLVNLPQSPCGYAHIHWLDIAKANLTALNQNYVVGLKDGPPSVSQVSCPTAITIYSDDSFAVFMDWFNYALRTIDLKTFVITTLHQYNQGDAPTYFSNILGTASITMNDYCASCPAGKYQNTAGNQTVCLNCAAAKYSTVIGAVSINNCSSCPVAAFATAAGSSSCLQCEAGYYYNASQSAFCITCLAGTYSSASNSTTCTKCAQGVFASSTQSSTCAYCAPGYYINASTFSACGVCYAGTYSTVSNSTKCTSCVVGSFSPNNISSSCTICPSGYYSNMSGSSTCSLCSNGSYTPASNSSVCTLCAMGYYTITPGSSTCSSCGTGVYLNSSASICQMCISGTFSNYSAVTLCTSCNNGTYSTAQQTVCLQCNAGTYSSLAGASVCLNCSMGTYGTNSSSVCSTCATGTFAYSTGSSSCVFCSPGSYFNASQSSSCTMCPAGTYSTGSGRGNCNQNCGPGMYSTSLGSTQNNTCLQCGAGTYFSSAGASVCLNCSMGTYGSQLGASYCVNCGAGTYLSSTGISNVPASAPSMPLVVSKNGLKHPPGTGQYCTQYFNLNGAHSSGLCDYASNCYFNGFTTWCPWLYNSGCSCTKTYTDGSSDFLCDAGCVSLAPCTYIPNSYFTGPGAYSADSCPWSCLAGYVQNGSSCVYQPPCTSCQAGTYNTMIGANSSALCTSCQAGTYGTLLGGTYCVTCSAGTYLSAAGISRIPATNASLPIAVTADGSKKTQGNGQYCSTYFNQQTIGIGGAFMSKQDSQFFCYLPGKGNYCPWPIDLGCTYLSNDGSLSWFRCDAGCVTLDPCTYIPYSNFTGPGLNSPDSCPWSCPTNYMKIGNSCVYQPPCTSCQAGTYTPIQGAATCLTCQCSANGYYPLGCGGSSPGSCSRCNNTV